MKGPEMGMEMEDSVDILLDKITDAHSLDDAERALRAKAARYSVYALSAMAAAARRDLLIWSADDPRTVSTDDIDVAVEELHYRQMDVVTPSLIWAEFFQAKKPWAKKKRLAICRKFALQAEQFEADLQITRPKNARRIQQARVRFWKLTAFMSLVLLPSLTATGDRTLGLEIVKQWRGALRSDRGLFKKGRFGGMMASPLFTTVGLATGLFLIGDVDLVFVRDGGVSK